MSAILYSTVRLSSPRPSCVSPPTSCPAAVLLHLGAIFSASFITAALLDDVFFRNTVITAKFALATHTHTPPKRTEGPYRPFAHSIRIWRGVVGVFYKRENELRELVSLQRNSGPLVCIRLYCGTRGAFSGLGVTEAGWLLRDF